VTSPADIEARLKAAQARHKAGDRAGAEGLYRAVLADHRDDRRALLLLGVLYLEGGRPQGAVAPLSRLVAVEPTHVDAHAGLGSALLALGRNEEAETHLGRAVALQPKHARAWGALAKARRALGRLDEAADALRRQVALAPDDVVAQTNLALVLKEMEDWAAAEAAYDRVLEMAPGNEAAILGKGVARNERGDYEAACRLLGPVVRAGCDEALVVQAYARAARNLGRPAEGVPYLVRAVERPGLSDDDQRALCFELGHVHDALKDYDAAFGWFRRGNERVPKTTDLTPDLVERLIAFFDADRFARLPRAPDPSELPLFIVGMPRSGTSLLEQILDAHPAVHGAGELNAILDLSAHLDTASHPPGRYPACLEGLSATDLEGMARTHLGQLAALAPGAARVTDKMPHNFLHLGLITLLFPGARVIHSVRDPVDTCLSCYFQDFTKAHAYAADLGQLGRHYRAYLRMMAHWKEVLPLPMKAVRYDALVADPEPVVRELLDFCGLPWDPACLAFHTSRRVVRTASQDQVRKPIYKSSVRRWARYESHLGPLLEALGDAVPRPDAP